MYIIEQMPSIKLNMETENRIIDYVDLEWHEIHKKILRVKSRNNCDIGIRLGDEVLSRGLREGDILYQDEETVIAVHILPSEFLSITVQQGLLYSIAKVCYEVGNTHGDLFLGESNYQFYTTYSEPIKKLLEKIEGVHVASEIIKPDFERQISHATIHMHHS